MKEVYNLWEAWHCSNTLPTIVQSGFAYYIHTTHLQEGQPLSYIWGCTKQLCGFEPREPWPHIIENLIVIVRWTTATKALFLNNRILHEFQMYLMSCSQMSMWTPFKFMWWSLWVVLVGWWCPPVTVCFSSEWYNLFEMVVHVCTGQFKAPISILLGWVPLLSYVTKWVSDGCFMPNGLFFSKNNLHSMRWCLLCTRPTNLIGSFSASPPKQQSPGRHVVPLGHIILITIQTVFDATNTNFIVLGLTRPVLELKIYRNLRRTP